MRKESFSGKKVKVFHGTFPIALAKVEDAVVITRREPRFGEPAIDMDGDGAHVEGVDDSGTVVIKIDPSSTATLQYLNGVWAAKLSTPSLSGRNMATQNKAFNCKNAVMSMWPWQDGTRPPVVEATFEYINGDYSQDGPRILPI